MKIVLLDLSVVKTTPATRIAHWEIGELNHVEKTDSHGSAGGKIKKVVVREIHGGPPQPANVANEANLEFWEEIGQPECTHSRACGMQGWQGTKDDGRVAECGSVHVEAKKLVDTCQSTRRTGHAVIGSCQAIEVLIPGRCSRSELLHDDPQEIHVSETPAEVSQGCWWAEEPDKCCDDKWAGKVHYSVR